MKLSIIKSIPAWLLAAIVLLTGCEAPTSGLVDSETLPAFDGSAELAAGDLMTTLTQELDLTSSQQASLQVAMQRHDRPDVTPGSLWHIAARLQGYLDGRQKARLFRVAAHYGSRQLQKLVGVYAPCVIGPHDDDEGALRIRFHLIADLLADEQRAELEELRVRYAAQIRMLHEQVNAGEITREDAAAQIRSLHEALAAAVRSILSDDQIAVLKERIAARGESADPHFQNSRRAMIDALNLRDEQVAALDELHRSQCADLEVLVRKAQAGEITREAFRNGLERLAGAKVKAYERILGDEQFESAKIHDALLVINARRYIHHVAGGSGTTDRRPDADRQPDPQPANTGSSSS